MHVRGAGGTTASWRAIERAVGRPLPRVTVPDFDYNARPATRLEVPRAQRIAEIRARKAAERARGAAQASAPSAAPTFGQRVRQRISARSRAGFGFAGDAGCAAAAGIGIRTPLDLQAATAAVGTTLCNARMRECASGRIPGRMRDWVNDCGRRGRSLRHSRIHPHIRAFPHPPDRALARPVRLDRQCTLWPAGRSRKARSVRGGRRPPGVRYGTRASDRSRPQLQETPSGCASAPTRGAGVDGGLRRGTSGWGLGMWTSPTSRETG